jgi:hypothetical protein
MRSSPSARPERTHAHASAPLARWRTAKRIVVEAPSPASRHPVLRRPGHDTSPGGHGPRGALTGTTPQPPCPVIPRRARYFLSQWRRTGWLLARMKSM